MTRPIFVRDLRQPFDSPQFGAFADNLALEATPSPNPEVDPTPRFYLDIKEGRASILSITFDEDTARALFAQLAKDLTLNGETLYLGKTTTPPKLGEGDIWWTDEEALSVTKALDTWIHTVPGREDAMRAAVERARQKLLASLEATP